MAERCPTCGSPVRVVGADEGTHYYEPLGSHALAELVSWHPITDEGLATLHPQHREALAKAREILSRTEASTPEHICPSCRVGRADYEGPEMHLPECPNCGSESDPIPSASGEETPGGGE